MLISPRGRIFGTCGKKGKEIGFFSSANPPLYGKVYNVFISVGGTEKPTTDEIGRALCVLDVDAPAGDRRSDAHDLCGCFAAVGNTAVGGVRLAGAIIFSLGGATVSTFGDSGALLIIPY